MKDFKFTSERYFTISDAKISHGQLLIRSQKRDDEDNNIDVIFYDTTFIHTPFTFKGLSIKFLDNSLIPSHLLIEINIKSGENKFYELLSEGRTYYVAASFVRVFVNKLEFHESSLDYNIDRGIEIASSLV